MKYNLANNEPLEINGDVYVKGVGTYDGTNAGENGVKTLKDILNSGVTEIIWSDLVDLRNNNELIPGQYYRITDYTCTTSQANTRSAGHQFDIIVTADDESTLNEEARAALHTGDEYFSGCTLSAWKIWYSLDNDANRFAWADSANGKGIIYRMIDEWNNDVPYDFKNIQFKHPNDTTTYPYYYYTFASGNVADNIDNSLSIANGCYFNTIKRYIYNFKNQKLNCIIFIGGICSKNSFEIDCYDNSFLEGSYRNSFGGYCYDNSFGFGCSNNSFGHGCSNNSFGHGCSNNSFGYGCSNNTFGIFYNNNSFGIDCTYNIFGQNCNGNTVGNGCDHIRFASDSSSAATKYNYYQHNHFGDGCQYILFKGEGTASEQQQVQNYNFAQGLQGTSSAYLTIEGVRNLSYEVQVAKNSKGEIKIYCEADLIA